MWWTVFEQHMQINSSQRSQVMSYCHGGKVLSSGGNDMGSPFILQQKTCQAAFQDLSAPTVQGEINSYLGRFIFPSLFMLLLLLSSLFSAGFSFLFHCSCPAFYPASLAAFPKLFCRFPMAPLSPISSSSSKNNTQGFLFGA